MNNESADLLASLAAIGRAMQEAFDPQRFLAEFSAHTQRFLPHDRLIIVYREEAGSLSVFAEHGIRGPALHEGRYTIDFDPGGRYAPAELVLDSVLAGEAMRVGNFQTDPRFVRPGVEAGEPVLIRDTRTELDPARAALHLDLFEQPGRKRIFPQPARTCSWRSFLNASSKTKQTSAHDWTFLESLLFGPSLEPVFSRG